MALVGDMVVQTANAPGTGAFNLIAPPAGRSSVLSQCGAGQVYYFAQDGTSWEKAVGTVTAGSPDTLSRDTVIGNSLGTTARISFSGAVTIICDIPAERSLWASADNSAVLVGNRRLSGVAAAIAADQAPRFDQIADRFIATYDVASGAVVIPLPTSTDTYAIELRRVVPSAAAQLYLRVSIDGGASYLTGTSEYAYGLMSAGSSVTVSQAVGPYAPLSASMSPYPINGTVVLDPLAHTIAFDLNGYQQVNKGSANWSNSSPVTHVIIGAAFQSLSSGRMRLVQKNFG